MEKKSTLLSLLQEDQVYPSISIILPLRRDVTDVREDQTKMHDAYAEVEKLLTEADIHEKQQLLTKLTQLIATYKKHPDATAIGIFVNPHASYMIPLTGSHTRQISLGSVFLLREILAQEAREGFYWVLILSSDFARLIAGHGATMYEIETPLTNDKGEPLQGFPLDMLPAEQRRIQAVKGGERDAGYLDAHMDSFFRLIAHELKRVIDVDNWPLIICGTPEQITRFKRVSQETFTILEEVPSDYRNIVLHNLSKLIWPLVQKSFAKYSKETLALLREAQNSTKYAYGLHRVWEMVIEGRIHQLFVEENLHARGRPNPENKSNLQIFEQEVAKNIQVDDIVDLIIRETIAHRGRITILPTGTLKEFEGIAAVLRY